MVRITDPDALDKLALIEGEPWKLDHSTRDGNYTFKGILATFQRYMEETKGRHGCSATIYGAGGWNRYPVDAMTGEIRFSRHNGRREDVPKAEAAGFRVI